MASKDVAGRRASDFMGKISRRVMGSFQTINL
jgi:hypothetical protein